MICALMRRQEDLKAAAETHKCPTETPAPALDTRYRIYVGESTVEAVRPIVADYIDAATFIEGVGLWECNTEPCVIIEAIGSRKQASRYEYLAARLRDRFEQDSVLLTVESVRGELI